MCLWLRQNKKRAAGFAGGAVALAIIITLVTIYLVNRDKDNADPPTPQVAVAQGALEGEWVTISVGSEKDKKLKNDNARYAAFRGIPYAKSPTGELRFKAPKSPDSWEGVRNATVEGSACLQKDTVTQLVTGSEDCLYLNVYTPKLPKMSKIQPLLPVYFFIHGGSFIFGSGSRSYYGPEFFMLKEVVVVTINYRLNVFGFLNLDNEVVPGNAGIKDQIAALKWVNKNIAKFGGDPDLITVGGQSAGAASAHWLTLLPESKGLIKRVILESGSALQSWAFNEDNVDVAKDLGQRLSNLSVTVEELSNLVMNLTAEEILAASTAMVDYRMKTNATQIPYATTLETRDPVVGGEPRLITQDPETYLLKDINPVPMFVGMNSREWLYAFYLYGYAASPAYMQSRIDDLFTVFPKNVLPRPDTVAYLNLSNTDSYEWKDVVHSVKLNYFDSKDTECNVTCTFKKYLDDAVIGIDISRLVEIRARVASSETYVYKFGVRDVYSLSPLVDEDQSNGGAVHSDELTYLWWMRILRQKLVGDGMASTTLTRMVNMWSSYIKNGTPDPKEKYGGTWEPNEKRKENCTIFMDITKELTVREEPIAGPNTAFWWSLFQKYRQSKST